MSHFSEAWLALREPADHAAINAGVRQRLRQYFADAGAIQIVDFGCGTGSNLRSLTPDLPAGQAWTLVDHDAQILAIAEQRTMSSAFCQRVASVRTQGADLATDDISHLIMEADLVTAAAFFDLVSQAFIDQMAAKIAKAGAAFLAILTYDGIVAWLPQHPLDPALRAAFNTHQRSDKGFGIAAGPDATDALAAAFVRHGYTVIRGASPWMLTSRFSELRRQTDEGWAHAVAETGRIAPADLQAWKDFRETASSAVTIVGHEDLLALPPE